MTGLVAADKNGDGSIDPQEFDGAGGSALWAALGANNDRRVSLEEVRAHLPKFLTMRTAGGGGRTPRTSTGLIALTDLKSSTYKGKTGGLYPGGSNDRPAAHDKAGVRLARSIRPLDGQGQHAPAGQGKVVFLSIGMSNPTQEFSTFKAMADADPAKNRALVSGDPALNFDPDRGVVKAPWLAWGPYLWADGLKARSEGLTYEITDLRPDDGTHPALPGRRKVARQLLDFLKQDTTAKVGFLD